jgi:type II secretory ATPase GspE/PulE/Tfp pilus assembly ATPase PilB-like protein
MPLEHYEMRPEEGDALARAFYNGLATVREDGTFNPLDFQNAQIAGDALPGLNLSSVRIVRGPSYPSQAGGGFMIARLQYASPKDEGAVPETGLQRLAKKGFTPLQLGLFEQMVRLPLGIVTVTGPTGSGKTTTLFELMRYQHQLFPESRQVTVEDPPENPLPWAIQLEAKSDEFADRVKTTLRMDPDIILVGELRDAHSALAAVQAAQTGHFCWATLHVTDPYKVFSRLETMDPKQLSFAHTCDHELFVGATSQRLVGKLCPDCSKPLSKAGDYVPRFMLDALKSWGDLSPVRVRGEGCKACGGLKIAGRAAVAELVITDESFMEDVLRQGILVARKNHRQKAGADKSMLANAMDLVLRGEVCPVDVHRGVHRLVTRGEER